LRRQTSSGSTGTPAYRGYDFSHFPGVHIERYVLYSGCDGDTPWYASTDELPDGAGIGIARDPSNQARALDLLVQDGLITLAATGDADATVLGYGDRVSTSERQRDLLSLERWSWLGGFVGIWYADPLTAEDGSTPDDLAAVEHEVGRRLPVELAEWFTLVGNRLEDVQDSPARPDQTWLVDDRVCVWNENQGVWSIVAGQDGLCSSTEEEHFPIDPVPVSAAIRGMVLSDMLFGAGPGPTCRGPLGRLARSVRGNTIEDVTGETLAAVQAAYPVLPVTPNPFFAAVAVHGDQSTILRGDLDTGLGLMWTTATAAALERMSSLVSLGGPSTP
jgi:hypothetical protein